MYGQNEYLWISIITFKITVEIQQFFSGTYCTNCFLSFCLFIYHTQDVLQVFKVNNPLSGILVLLSACLLVLFHGGVFHRYDFHYYIQLLEIIIQKFQLLKIHLYVYLPLFCKMPLEFGEMIWVHVLQTYGPKFKEPAQS